MKEHNKRNLLAKIKNYKKLDFEKLQKEDYQTKQYLKSLSIADARLKFALRTCMTRTVQANFKGDPMYRANNWQCHDCKVLDTQDHIVRCPVYSSIRSGKDLQKDTDLVEYFRKVIDIRSKDNSFHPWSYEDCSGTGIIIPRCPHKHQLFVCLCAGVLNK